MQPIKFKFSNRTLIGPEGSGIQPIPVYTDGKGVTSKWELSDAEIEQIVKERSVYLTVYSGETAPPVWLQVESPFPSHPEALHEFCYVNLGNAKADNLWVWNTIDGPAPRCLKINGNLYVKDPVHIPRFTVAKQMKAGEYYIRLTHPGEEREAFGEEVALIYMGGKDIEGLLPIPKDAYGHFTQVAKD